MPYQNEHACRLKSPDDFKSESFRRVTREHENKEYSIIMGRLKGETTMIEQAYRYDKTEWTESSARTHCSDHEGTFEPALKGESEAETDGKWIPVAKANQTKQLENGGKVVLTEEALKKSVQSWKNGNIIINHKESIGDLKILDAKYESPFLFMQFDPNTERLFRNTDATGWSVQFDPNSLKFDGDMIIDGVGIGVSILYPPHVPTCTPNMGCNETNVFEMYNDFEGRTLSAKNESELKAIAEDVKKGFERLWSLLKNITTAKPKEGEEKEVSNQEQNLEKEKMDEKEKVELTSQFEATMKAKVDELTTKHEIEVKELKDRISGFEKEETERVKTEKDAQFEKVIAKLPPGMTHKDEDKTKLRARFDNDPTALMVELISLEHKEGTGEEGNEFDHQMNEDIAAIRELKEDTGRI